MAPMSDITTIGINHIYRDSKFRKLSFFLEKYSLFVMTVNGKKFLLY